MKWLFTAAVVLLLVACSQNEKPAPEPISIPQPEPEPVLEINTTPEFVPLIYPKDTFERINESIGLLD